MEGLQITLGVERRAFRRLIQANGWLMLEAVATTVRQSWQPAELVESKARRRQENIARNDAIRADAAAA
ncbi:hypothetical protein J0H58_31380 [bacterium]|nr:hypothetical protein [bacterium]